MKRILVPTDFSNNAYSALFYATRLFQKEPCEFFILNTFDVNTPGLTSRLDTSKGDLLYKQLSAESEDNLIEISHKIVRDTEDYEHSFETISVSKDLAETINKTIRSKKIDLVVMGTKGASGLKEVFMGSNTVKVIQKIKNCPILTIPNEYDFRVPKSIAFATDFSRLYSREELEPLIKMTELFGGSIHILHVNEEEKLTKEQDYNITKLREYFKETEFSIHWVPSSGQKSETIQTFIDQMGIDILVMLRYRHSIIESITHEPIVKKIGFAADIPFLVIPTSS
ncbi:universal stress protein [Aquimarina sp. D1M17]|uniref:universal stress protein n=1 Tax=Aquimarina acroporae TaxID=2937283 RepID=UPI0020BF6493|nr:universal stress protein [Aquimarina acroporae]MCK8520949.1 universal stress protein [Aquimarina acroporae]